MRRRPDPQLKSKPDGKPRLLSYLSIGEAEDYRPDYFTPEYMTEDAPDWLLSENERWKGNRRIRFCEEGWQRTILGDDDGRNVYNSIEPSPLYRLIEAGVDGVYLDRVDVYSEVEKQCPDAARQMVAFVVGLAAHARKKNPNFIVMLQNAEELLAYKDLVNAIDGVAKEDLFYGADHSERPNPPAMVRDTGQRTSNWPAMGGGLCLSSTTSRIRPSGPPTRPRLKRKGLSLISDPGPSMIFGSRMRAIEAGRRRKFFKSNAVDHSNFATAPSSRPARPDPAGNGDVRRFARRRADNQGPTHTLRVKRLQRAAPLSPR